MATKKKASFEAQIFSWGSAAGLAVLVFVLLLVLGGWGIIQAIWMAAVAFLVLGAFNYFVFARPTPPLAGSFPPEMASGAGKAAAPSTLKGPTEQPKPTSLESAEPPAEAMRTAAASQPAPEPKAAPKAAPAGDKGKTE